MTSRGEPPRRRGVPRRVRTAVRTVKSIVEDVLVSSRTIDLLEAVVVSFVISGLAWNVSVGYGVISARWSPPLTITTTLLLALWLRYLDTIGESPQLPS